MAFALEILLVFYITLLIIANYVIADNCHSHILLSHWAASADNWWKGTTAIDSYALWFDHDIL